jgi:hypothetical protein
MLFFNQKGGGECESKQSQFAYVSLNPSSQLAIYAVYMERYTKVLPYVSKSLIFAFISDYIPSLNGVDAFAIISLLNLSSVKAEICNYPIPALN